MSGPRAQKLRNIHDKKYLQEFRCLEVGDSQGNPSTRSFHFHSNDECQDEKDYKRPKNHHRIRFEESSSYFSDDEKGNDTRTDVDHLSQSKSGFYSKLVEYGKHPQKERGNKKRNHSVTFILPLTHLQQLH